MTSLCHQLGTSFTYSLIDMCETGLGKISHGKLRDLLDGAIITFETQGMGVYGEAAKFLAQEDHWQEVHAARARCMAIYHMYIYFYHDHLAENDRKDFLKLIFYRYMSAVGPIK